MIDGLVDEGTLTIEPMPRALAPPAARSGFRRSGFFAAAAHRGRCDARVCGERKFHVALLDGVTGSGKTEVYFEAVAEIIRRGKQALILMPEIALTGQFLDRFARASACGRTNGIRN